MGGVSLDFPVKQTKTGHATKIPLQRIGETEWADPAADAALLPSKYEAKTLFELCPMLLAR